jgi:hypothetical protein
MNVRSFDIDDLIDGNELPLPDKDTLVTKLNRFLHQRLIATVYNRCDWDIVLSHLNAKFDRLELALAVRDPVERNKLLLPFVADVKRAKARARGLNWFSAVFEPSDVMSRRVADLFSGMFLSAMIAMVEADDRFITQRRLILVGAALAAHRTEFGQYPTTLDELVPRFLKAAPNDAFGNRKFVYQASNSVQEKTYILYSLGKNGTDEGGINCRNGNCLLDITFSSDWSRIPEATVQH